MFSRQDKRGYRAVVAAACCRAMSELTLPAIPRHAAELLPLLIAALIADAAAAAAEALPIFRDDVAAADAFRHYAFAAIAVHYFRDAAEPLMSAADAAADADAADDAMPLMLPRR